MCIRDRCHKAVVFLVVYLYFNPPRGAEIIQDPTIQPLPGFTSLTRRQWVQANRIRTRHGRTAKNLNRWGYQDTQEFPACGISPQDMDHLILDCPVTAIPRGYDAVHRAEEDFTEWLQTNSPTPTPYLIYTIHIHRSNKQSLFRSFK